MMNTKKHTPLAIMAALAAFAMQGQGALVGHWKFDDGSGSTAVDSANGNDATWQGGAGTNTWVTGLIGGATQHNDEDGGNGTEHFITSTIPEMAGATQMTMSIWFNLNSEENNNSTYNGLMMSRNVNPTVGQSWGIALEDNGAPRHLDARVSNAPVDSADIIPAGSGWHHAVLVWDSIAGTRTVYYDGDVSIVSAADSTGTIVSFADLRFGDDPCCGAREFTGSLDDATLWDEALTAAQVKAIYDAGLLGIDAATAIPEPSTTLVALLGTLLLLRRRR